MAYSGKSKAKILYLLKILQEETDSEHGLTMPQIIKRLKDYGITAERKGIYNDIKTLRDFDIDVKTYRRRPVEYGIERRDFKTSELALMVDAIQSCRAITQRQADALVVNIKQLANNHEQDLLNRHIHVVGRAKSKGDGVPSTIDSAHEAIRSHCMLEFVYRKMGIDGELHATRNGEKHTVTPISISYDDGFYYLTTWDELHEDSTTEYRLDRMADVQVLKDMPAAKNEVIANYRHDSPQAAVFGRFFDEGAEVVATLSADGDKVEILTDRFGDLGEFMSPDGSRARMRVRLYKSAQFFGWVASMNKLVRIEGPQWLVNEYRDYLRSLLED